MKNAIYLAFAFILLVSANARDMVRDQRGEFDAFARHATIRLPAGWHVGECSFGPQEIAMFWGPRPVGLQVRLDGPQLWYPHFYSGPPMSSSAEHEYFRERPESIYILIVPHSYRPQKDSFLVDWFRPEDQKTHRIGSIRRLDLYAYGLHCISWPRWRTDLKNNLLH